MNETRKVLQFDPQRFAKRTPISEIPCVARDPRRHTTTIKDTQEQYVSLASLMHPQGYAQLQREGLFNPNDQDLLGTDRYPVLSMDAQETSSSFLQAWCKTHAAQTRLLLMDCHKGLWYCERTHKTIAKRYPYANLCYMVRNAQNDHVAHPLVKTQVVEIVDPSALLLSYRQHMIVFMPAIANGEEILSLPRIDVQLSWPDHDTLVDVIDQYATFPVSVKEKILLSQALEHHFEGRYVRK